MAMSNDRIVRRPLWVRERSSRPFDQRLLVRFPRLLDAYARLVLARLPPTSRIRQAALSRGTRVSLEAFNRRDVDAAVVPSHPDFEMYPPREFVEVGFFEPCYRGPEGFREYVSTWSEVLGPDLGVEPRELIDLGERLVMLGDLKGHGKASGVPLSGEIATISVLKDGKATRVTMYLNHADALEAAGLSG